MVDKQPHRVEGGFRECVRKSKMLGKSKVLEKACSEERRKKSYAFLDNSKKQTDL